MRTLRLLQPLCALLLCSGAWAAENATIENERRMHRALEAGNVDAAARFLPLFRSPTSEQSLLLAQFELMTCQPRALERRLASMPEGEQRTLFEAVLLALVSVERGPAETPTSTPALTKNVVEARLPLDQSEIWPDEWREVGLAASQCRAMPVASDPRLRARLSSRARDLFEKLPLEPYLRDFNIVALALDVKARVPRLDRVLAHYRRNYSNPYYRQLLALAERDERSLNALAVSGIAKNEVRLGELVAKETLFKAHSVSIPFLLGQRSDR